MRDKGTLTQRLVQCKFLDGSWDEDVASFAAGNFVGGESADLEQELQRSHILAALKGWQKQIYNGTGADAGGFPGMNSLFTSKTGAGVVDAGGTSANTGSSIYLVKTGVQEVCTVWGNDGEIAAGDIFETLIQEPQVDGSIKKYNAKAQNIAGWAGLQISNHQAIVRICNVTEDNGHTCNDALIYKALELFETQYGEMPDGILMSYRSRRQLRDSRTATNPSGTPAPLPTEVENVPVIATLGINKTEALLA